MVVYPPSKINIGLSITGKRHDGFHDIETVFYPIPLCDMLTVEATETGTTEKLDFACEGIGLSGCSPHDNLCCRAYRMLDADCNLPPAKIRLRKAIPAGAGLGGGSSDAAYTLKALNGVFRLQLADEALAMYASRLGSDCAFFLHPVPTFGSGRGDILKPFALSLAEYHILLIKPPVSVSTADAYAAAVARKPQHYLPELLQAPVGEWRYTVFNDFEESVFKKFPEIGRIKEHLYRNGAVYAAMSGSGSSVYGIFRGDPAEVAKQFPDCFVWSSRNAGVHKF